MDNNLNKDIKNNGEEKKPTGIALFVAITLSALFFSACVYFFDRSSVYGMMLAASIAAVCFSFVVRFVRTPVVMAIPFVGVALAPDKMEYAIMLSAAVAVCGAFLALMLIRRWDSFSFFIGGSLLYSVMLGGAAVIFLTETCGSFSAGLEEIMTVVPAWVNEMLKSYGEDMAALFAVDPQVYVAILPSVVVTAGIMLMWLTNRLIGGFYAILGGIDATCRARTGAPKALAWIFILIAIFGTVLASDDMNTYYAILNLKTVLTAVFFGEGVRAFIHKILFMRGIFTRVVLAVFVVNLFLFLSPVAIIALAYYGVYKTLYRRTVITIIRKDQ